MIEDDSEVYSLIRDKPIKISNSAVINDLGQINILFSDKTGTLTCNEMKFKSMAIGCSTFGNLNNEGPGSFQSCDFEDFVSGKQNKDIHKLILSKN